MARSLARTPYCTVTDCSTRAVDDARADPGPASPVYQDTVFAGVPLTSDVAVLNGEPPTRSGGRAAVAAATNVIGAPLTVMVSPAAKLVVSESVLAAPDNSVAPVIGAGIAALLLTTLPVAVPAVLKKLSDAATADAATSDVLASAVIAVFSAAFRLAAVAVEVRPMAKLPTGGGV